MFRVKLKPKILLNNFILTWNYGFRYTHRHPFVYKKHWTYGFLHYDIRINGRRMDGGSCPLCPEMERRNVQMELSGKMSGERNVRFPLPQCCHQLAAGAPTLTTNRYSDCNLPKFNELFHVVDRNLSILFKFHENLLKAFEYHVKLLTDRQTSTTNNLCRQGPGASTL